ncbi:MAG: TatD family hydrolase [Anaerolineales bacterium]
METGRLIDSHCHLSDDAFADDLSAVLLRARDSGVSRVVVPGVDLPTSTRAVELAESTPGLFAAVGIHPHEARHWTADSVNRLRELARSPGVVAIGEIGLDYYRDHSPRQQQRHAFEKQLALAAELGLPVIVHNRESIDDVLATLLPWAAGLPAPHRQHPGVLHAFSADVKAGQQAVAAGFLLGIAGPITFRNADERRRITQALPVEHMLVETDSPYLTPHPHRGGRNEPAYVRLVAESLADMEGMDHSELAALTTSNASELFGWNHGTENSDLL